ncbi:MAG: hypothetical protein HGA70_00500 [Chlorobiaceae bacterium]|nr:hypothetical protein [Chlorobiaceae bacterium]
MNPARTDKYCFDHIHLWVQYDKKSAAFIEVVIEVYYPLTRDAEGLVMFSHGFLIGNDPLYYPRKLAGVFTGDNPLFGINPSRYYNYTAAAIENNWAIAYVSASHLQFEGVPWLDFGGNPRVGQDAFVAASYLIKYGSTDYFYLLDTEKKRSRKAFMEEIRKYRFIKQGCNNVIFAGHSVGGAHAQVAACGFQTMQEIGKKTGYSFDPVMYDREVLPRHSDPMSEWDPSELANPVGLLQFSPVDQQIPFLVPGVAPYRKALAEKPLPSLMIIGECDCASLDSNSIQKPPAWSPDPGAVTQFSQLSPKGSDSWAVVANVERGSHCGYLTEENTVCSLAGKLDQCERCKAKEPYAASGAESRFSDALLGKLIGSCSGEDPFGGDFCRWIRSDCMTWLNTRNPGGHVNLLPFSDGSYTDYSGKGARCS